MQRTATTAYFLSRGEQGANMQRTPRMLMARPCRTRAETVLIQDNRLAASSCRIKLFDSQLRSSLSNSLCGEIPVSLILRLTHARRLALGAAPLLPG